MANRLYGGTRRDAEVMRRPGSRTAPTITEGPLPEPPSYLPETCFAAPESIPANAKYATLYRGKRTTRCVIVQVLPTHKFGMATLDIVSEGEVIGRQQQVPIFDTLDDQALEARLVQCPGSLYAIREP